MAASSNDVASSKGAISCVDPDFVRINKKKTVGRMPMGLRSRVLACLFLVAFTAPHAFAADDYPQRPIRIIVPFPGGAGPDQVARLLGKHLQEAFNETVIIENRAGALGSIGATEVARAAPDGYTL